MGAQTSENTLPNPYALKTDRLTDWAPANFAYGQAAGPRPGEGS